MARPIPETVFLFKEGLYIDEYDRNVGNLSWTVWNLYSTDGWCFYDLTQPENYVDGDVGSGLVPENQRVYAQYMTMRKNEQYVTNNIICVPVEPGFLSGNDSVTA